MEINFRCECPITSALDIVGDKWILVIVKQMLFQGKETFKDFTTSEESISTNILTTKLKFLEQIGLVRKSKTPTNKKSIYYHLTEKGLSLAPIIIDLAIWSDENLRELNGEMQKNEWLHLMKTNREDFIRSAINKYKEKLASETYLESYV